MITGEQGDLVEGALQFSHENVHEAVFGQVPRLFGALVVNHHFLLPAHLHLHEGQMARNKLDVNHRLQRDGHQEEASKCSQRRNLVCRCGENPTASNINSISINETFLRPIVRACQS